ncbi:MAG: lipid II:glycine glycyltransferase FemX [bacterium]
MQIITDPKFIDPKDWSNFVKKHPYGNVFQTPQMYEVYSKTKNYEPVFVAIVKSNKVLGILLSVIQKENNGLLGIFTARSIVFGGPLYFEDNPEILSMILTKYIKIIKNKAIYTQIRIFNKLDDCVKAIYKKYGFDFQDHLNIIVSLKPSIEEMWKDIKRKRKDGINKASKVGFNFLVEDKLSSINSFYVLLKQLYQNIKLPFPDISFFQNINNNLTPYTKWFTLSYKGNPIIILCAFCFKKTVNAFVIGIIQDSTIQNLRPVDLFYWEVFKWCSQNGIENFDWMGAGKPNKDYGVRKFKLQYGGEAENFGRFSNVHKPFLYQLGKIGIKVLSKIK